MIPIKLKISGFLSYRDPVEVDFSSFDLACISGHNGAGKSSLLDAMTWALFGQARKRDESLINSACEQAEVVFIFHYELNDYRITRIMQRGKTGILEFNIKNGDKFEKFSEATSRGTQERIENTLHLDYETFINASFFLQGKADQFTQQRPADRKRILASILGLEIWEKYKEKAAEKRKELEGDVASLEGRMDEISKELGEEDERKKRLKELETELSLQQENRKAHEQVLQVIKQTLESLKRQDELVGKLNGQVERGRMELNQLSGRQASRSNERNNLLQVTSRAGEVDAAYQKWQSARESLGEWDKIAESFREQEKERQVPLANIQAEQARLTQERDQLSARGNEIRIKRQQAAEFDAELRITEEKINQLENRLLLRAGLEESQTIISRFHEQARLREAPLTEINTEAARLEQELKTLEKQSESVESQRGGLAGLQLEVSTAQTSLKLSEEQLEKIKKLESTLQEKKVKLQSLKNENDRLKVEMNALIERIKKLEGTEGADCPLCGQPLNFNDRQRLIESLKNEGKEKGDLFRKNGAESELLLAEVSNVEKETSGMTRLENERTAYLTAVTKNSERLQTLQLVIQTWEDNDAGRLVSLREILRTGNFCKTARQYLARIDRELQAIGTALGIQAGSQKNIFESIDEKVFEIEKELSDLNGLQNERIQLSSKCAQIKEQISSLLGSIEHWEKVDEPRLAALNEILQSGNYSKAERKLLAEIDDHLRSIGYDAAAHEEVRRQEITGRTAENELREVEASRAALAPLERELQDIQNQIKDSQAELDEAIQTLETERSSLETLRTNTPDPIMAERALMDAREREQILTRDAGAAQQKVNVLNDLRKRKISYESQREEIATQIKHHKTLERAFGKDGVPALLIEQALPQIEEKANDLLDRLSNGSMSVRFVTQSEYKDRKRDDLKETLEIQISDSAGTRDYEMFSGGEAFRVNFAVRLALSEILARRTGARLQTLVIDEGFGSQDSEGRQRLVEAINEVRPDFSKILIITHLEDLKEVFPNRIEVEKTDRGSTVLVY